MRFSYIDVFTALDNANKLLQQTNKTEKLIVKDNYNFISIFSKNIDTNCETLMLENVLRDEGYRWLEGFNTALMNEQFCLTPIREDVGLISRFKKFFKIHV